MLSILTTFVDVSYGQYIIDKILTTFHSVTIISLLRALMNTKEISCIKKNSNAPSKYFFAHCGLGTSRHADHRPLLLGEET